jgi:hypothetical protein
MPRGRGLADRFALGWGEVVKEKGFELLEVEGGEVLGEEVFGLLVGGQVVDNFFLLYWVHPKTRKLSCVTTLKLSDT